MALPSFPQLYLRSELGQALTHEQMDGNLKALRAYAKLIAAVIQAIFKEDGTLKDGAIATETAFADRVVSQRALAAGVAFAARDTGVTNAYVISFTPAIIPANGQVYWILAANTNLGASTLKIDATTWPIRKRNGLELEAGDLQAGSVFAVAMFDNIFHLIISDANISSSLVNQNVNFTGVTAYAPADSVLPTVSATLDFAHGFGVNPSRYEVSLICITTDAGYAVGTLIPIFDLTDGSKEPAFSVSADSTAIHVLRNTTNLYVGDVTALTPGSWKLRIRAENLFNQALNIFPALTFSVKSPHGAFSYGTNLFYFQYGQNQNKIYTERLDLTNNNLTFLEPASSGPDHNWCNVAVVRRSDGTDDALYTSSTGVYRLPMLEVASPAWKPVQLCTTASRYAYKPVWFVEAAGAITFVYAATSGQGFNSISTVTLYKITVSSGVAATQGLVLDMTSASILSADGTPGNVQFRKWHQSSSAASIYLFQYNPVSQRIYVMTEEIGHIHIFKLTGSGVDPYGAGTTGSNFLDWWSQSNVNRFGTLQYVKTIGVPGDGASWRVTNQSFICVEFDNTTGEEKAITFSRSGENPVLPGSVTRVNWKE